MWQGRKKRRKGFVFNSFITQGTVLRGTAKALKGVKLSRTMGIPREYS